MRLTTQARPAWTLRKHARLESRLLTAAVIERAQQRTGEEDMARFTIHDVQALENTSASPGALRTKIGDMIVNSVACRAKVEAVNPHTGEYRLVLQGTLGKDEKFEQY
jgi:hypothetical protein